MIFSVLTVRRWRLNCMQLIVLYVYLFVLYPDYDVNVIYATSFWCEYVTGLSTTVTHWFFRNGRYLYSSFDPQWQLLLFIFKFIFSYTSMGGGKGKKDVIAKRFALPSLLPFPPHILSPEWDEMSVWLRWRINKYETQHSFTNLLHISETVQC